jgi:hypothetical protein
LIITVLKYCIVSFKKGPSWSWSYDSLDLQLLVQWMPITTKIVSLNPADGEVYLIQHYMKKIVSDLRQVNDFLRGVSSIIKIITHKTGYVHKCIHRNSTGMYSYFIMDTINKYSDNQQCITIRKDKT